VLEKAPENIRLSDELRGRKDELLRVAREFGFEGLVAKRKNSVYESGRRSGAWVKFKITKSQEFVIGGYTLPEGARSHFGSLAISTSTSLSAFSVIGNRRTASRIVRENTSSASPLRSAPQPNASFRG
jgi:bifunctional non-homologous end joining protein LigD